MGVGFWDIDSDNNAGYGAKFILGLAGIEDALTGTDYAARYYGYERGTTPDQQAAYKEAGIVAETNGALGQAAQMTAGDIGDYGMHIGEELKADLKLLAGIAGACIGIYVVLKLI